MRKETAIKNIEHCDYYIKNSKKVEHIDYYQTRKQELLQQISDSVEVKKVIKVKSTKSPKKIATEYIDLVQAKKLKIVDIAKYEKVNVGSLSKAIFRIRNKM